MDIAPLQQYSDLTKQLTDNDRKRLQQLTDDEFSKVIQYMLENNCKLEQEAISSNLRQDIPTYRSRGGMPLPPFSLTK